MARLPRLSVAGCVHHVIQRGHNRQHIFLSDADRQFFLALLEENARKFFVAIHAYVLMDNHFHLLATPQAADTLANMMQSLGRRYVRYFNDMHQRSGTLWDGRYRSTVLQAEKHLLNCMAYVDLNPVRAGVVQMARDFEWSSHRHYVGLRTDKFLQPHVLAWTLGNTPFAREAAYGEMVRQGITTVQSTQVTDFTLGGWPLGGQEFLDALEKDSMRRIQKGRPGRPVKA
jgi:putative transposase